MHRDHPVGDYASVVTGDAQFIDVREPDEFADGSLPGAFNMPLSVFGDRLDELDPSRRVVVLCRSGGRSTTASEVLTEAGFTDVVNLAGGMLAVAD
ncbi:MAG: rhodanese-like domain-containing protein [Actinomycetota bacterium]